MEILRWRHIAGKDAFHAARASWSGKRFLRYHGHDFAELFWINSGRGIHRINGMETPLQPGALVFMRPEDVHGIVPAASVELGQTNIAFPCGTLEALQARYFTGKAWAFWQKGKLPAMTQIDQTQLGRFNRWADELAASPRETFYIDRFLLNVLAELLRGHDDPVPENAPDWLAQACRACQKRENFSGGSERFLALCGRSREHVARTVRQIMGVTPTDYINRIRMTYAQRQLEMTDQGILDIALDCGIGNLSHFYRLFREHTSLTPRAYRLAHRRPL